MKTTKTIEIEEYKSGLVHSQDFARKRYERYPDELFVRWCFRKVLDDYHQEEWIGTDNIEHVVPFKGETEIHVYKLDRIIKAKANHSIEIREEK